MKEFLKNLWQGIFKSKKIIVSKYYNKNSPIKEFQSNLDRTWNFLWLYTFSFRLSFHFKMDLYVLFLFSTQIMTCLFFYRAFNVNKSFLNLSKRCKWVTSDLNRHVPAHVPPHSYRLLCHYNSWTTIEICRVQYDNTLWSPDLWI